MSVQSNLDRLEGRLEKLEVEVLLGRYITSAFVQFYLAREPEGARQAVFNKIMGEARALAEIDGWASQFDAIFEFQGDDARNFVRRKALSAPFFL